MKSLRDWQELAHDNAVAHGFIEQTLPESCALLHSEVSELFEAYRKNTLWLPCDKVLPNGQSLTSAGEEIADIILRALDISARLGLDIERVVEIKHAYNVSRPYLHGGKLA